MPEVPSLKGPEFTTCVVKLPGELTRWLCQLEDMGKSCSAALLEWLTTAKRVTQEGRRS
jgi:hypothetical protein